MEATRRLREAYGFDEVRVVSDSVDLPLDAWRRDFGTVTVLSAFDRGKYAVDNTVALDSKHLREHFPERRMERGELGNATAETLADLTGQESLECRAFVGSFSGQPKGDSTSLQLECSRRPRSRARIDAPRDDRSSKTERH